MSKKIIDVYGISRLKVKNSEQAIIQLISENFNLASKVAEAYYSEIKQYFSEHMTNKAKGGEMLYEAIDIDEPAGKPIKNSKRKLIKLTFQTSEDFKIIKEKGLPELRRYKIQRFCNETISQGAVLTYEDLAHLFTTSIGTIKSDARILREQKILIPTRGREKDIGRTITHKKQIIEFYLQKYSFTEIKTRTHHSSESIERYLNEFKKIICLKENKIDISKIRLITKRSETLIKEYLEIYERAKKNPIKYLNLKDLQESLKKGALELNLRLGKEVI